MIKEEGVVDHVQRLDVRSAGRREGWTDVFKLASKARLPVIYDERNFPNAGGWA